MLPSLFIFVKNYKYIERKKKFSSLKLFEALARDLNNSWDEMPQKMVCFFFFVFRYKAEWFEKHLLNSLEVFWGKVEPITKKSMVVDKTIRAKR